MQRIRNLPIQQKVLMMTLVICGAVLMVAIGALFVFQVLTFRSNFQRDAATLAVILANNSTPYLEFENESEAKEMLKSLAAKPTVLSALLVRPDGRVIGSYGQTENAD